MKPLPKFFVFLAILTVSFAQTALRAQDAPPPPPPDDQSNQADQGDQGTSFQTFYDQLGDQGHWIQTDAYGYVFQPNVTDPNWAPYTDGHWVYTDAGWAWVSDEPWGWATYHYGRWANIDGTGWVWVPGYRWAPAWVSWRYGGGYCGWAPLPPSTFVGVEFGNPGFDAWSSFHFGGDVDVSFGIGAGCYNFVSIGDMGYPNYRGRFIDHSRNFAIINNTTNVTNININKTVINNYGAGGTNFRGVAVGGPPINEVNAHAAQRIQTVQLAEANQPGRSTLEGNTLAVYAPRVNAATLHQARPAQVAQTLAHPTLNRGVSITKPLAVNASLKPAAPSAAAIQAAQTAQLHAPARAKIATAKTVPRTTINKPLTSMQTASPTRQAATTGASTINTYKTGVEHATANSPYTGEPVNAKPNVEHAPANSPYTGEPFNAKPSVEHATANSPYTGEPFNAKPSVEHATANSPYTGESSSQSEAAEQRRLEQQKEEHAQALQNERESQPVHQAPAEEERPVEHYQAPVEHASQPLQPAYHPQSQAQPKAAPQGQPAAKKENQGGNGQGGPGGPQNH
jgi:hypothetical protein